MAAEQKPAAHQSSADGANARAAFRTPVELGQLLVSAIPAAAVLLGMQSILMSLFGHQSVWKTSWVVAAVFMGPGVLRWPAVFDIAPITAAITAIYPTALVCVVLIEPAAYHLSPKSSLVAGGVLGLLFYGVDLFGLARFFPWLVHERNWMALLSYLVFGVACAWMLVQAQRRTSRIDV